MTRKIPSTAGLMLSAFSWVGFAFSQRVGTDPALHYGLGINADPLNTTRIGGPEATSTGWWEGDELP